MPIQYQGSAVPTSFATCSVGLQSEIPLPDKLNGIRQSGFGGIELSMPDILAYGKSLNGAPLNEKDYDSICEVANKIRSLTEELGLSIMMLQPFPNFEGWTKGRFGEERKDAFTRAQGWMRVMEAVGTDMLQIGSSDAEGISSNFDELASDLAELADMMAPKGFKIAYENWCWATWAPDWKHVWQIVEKANRPNIGVCLDTFQSGGGEYGDPTTVSGLVEGISQADLDSRWRKSLAELSATVPADKIFLVQISDAYKMSPPIDQQPKQGGRPRSVWSHDYRPLPGHGGYLPVQAFLDAVLATGFRGWLSMEVFDGVRTQTDSDAKDYTAAAMKSLEKLLESAR